MNKIVKQIKDNFPDEIKTARRFFKVAEKVPIVKDWSNPNNQTTLAEINGLAGFDTAGHGVRVDYCFLDFDHVLNDEGNFETEKASDCVYNLLLTFPNIYIEKSISGHGLHAFLIPTADKFSTLSAGDKGTLYFSDSRDDDAPKLEIFHNTNGRNCLLTGNLYDEGNLIPSGGDADNFLAEILEEIKSQHAKFNPARTDENIFADSRADSVNYNSKFDDPPEYTRDLAIACFECIDAANLSQPEWLPCISALKGIGFSMEQARAMCQNSTHYTENGFNSQWNACDSYNIATLTGKAKKVGFNIKDFKKQWYKEHPEIKQAYFVKSENAFDDEKAASIEKIRRLEDFSDTTIFQAEILKALAFCKIFSPPDYSQTINKISEYGNKHRTEKVNLQDLKGELKEYIAEIEKFSAEINQHRAVLNAEKKTAEFVLTDDFLSNVTIPAPFAMNDEGILKVVGGKEISICYAPIVISRKIQDLNTNTVKFVLAYYKNRKRREIPAVAASTIADKRNIPKLADFNLPFNSNNAGNIVEFLDAFKYLNQDIIPLDFSVKNCGWLEHNGKNFFIDPRLTYQISNPDDSKAGNLIIDSDNYIANFLKQKGDLNKSKEAFNIAAEKSPLAAFFCYLAVSPFLLKILGERNFVAYLYGNTRGGKSTLFNLAMSLVGSNKLLFSFDATPKAISELAAVYSDYVLPIDEKQVTDLNLRENFPKIVYSLANGKGRTKLNRDSTLNFPKEWRNITIANGETKLAGDNVTGGFNTRLLELPAPDKIFDDETANLIREIIADNYGNAFPRVLELGTKKFDDKYLRERFKNFVTEFEKHSGGEILTEYCRYIAVGAVGGFLLHMVFGDDEQTAHEKSFTNCLAILDITPTLAEISDVEKEKQMILDFIAVNQNHFIGGNIDDDKIQGVWGKLDDEEYIYIARPIVEKACKENGFDYKKLVKDLIAAGFFAGAPTQKWIVGANGRHFKIKKEKT